MANNTQKAIVTIKADAEKVQKVLDDLEAISTSIDDPAKSGRRLRVKYHLSNILISVARDDNNLVLYAVVTRNLSCHGLAFIHGHFIHLDRRCIAQLPTVDGEMIIDITGRVVRCRHLMGTLHEVAVIFEKPIKLDHFVQLTSDQMEQLQSESPDHDQQPDTVVSGRVLVIDPVPNHRRLTEMFLVKIGLEIERLDGSDPLAKAPELDVDLVLLDLDGRSQFGTQAIKTLRDSDYGGLVVAMSAQEEGAFRYEAIQAGADVFLNKPFDLKTVRKIIQELSTSEENDDTTPGPLRSDLIDDEDMKPLIIDFVQDLADQITELNEACQCDDVDTMREICLHLKGSGASYGFGPVTDIASLALAALDQNRPNTESLKTSINDVIDLVRRAVAD